MGRQRRATGQDRPTVLTRRGFLGGVGAAALGLSACSRPSAPVAPAPTAPTITSLLESAPFYIAHRGGGGNWPEMTGYAYEQAAKLPNLHALEISVCRSADGVLVCSHDPTTARVCGVDYTIVDETWQTLSTLQVTAAGTTDPAQPSRPLTKFDDVVGRYIDRFVLFVEPKTPEAVQPLMRKMAGFSSPERVVWKQPMSSDFSEAKSRGFTTWAYLLEPAKIPAQRISEIMASDSIDMIGIQKTELERVVKPIIAAAAEAGKPVIMWPLTTAVERDRAVRLGCSGLMTSNVTELVP